MLSFWYTCVGYTSLNLAGRASQWLQLLVSMHPQAVYLHDGRYRSLTKWLHLLVSVHPRIICVQDGGYLR